MNGFGIIILLELIFFIGKCNIIGSSVIIVFGCCITGSLGFLPLFFVILTTSPSNVLIIFFFRPRFLGDITSFGISGSSAI